MIHQARPATAGAIGDAINAGLVKALDPQLKTAERYSSVGDGKINTPATEDQ